MINIILKCIVTECNILSLEANILAVNIPVLLTVIQVTVVIGNVVVERRCIVVTLHCTTTITTPAILWLGFQVIIVKIEGVVVVGSGWFISNVCSDGGTPAAATASVEGYLCCCTCSSWRGVVIIVMGGTSEGGRCGWWAGWRGVGPLSSWRRGAVKWHP